jgi:hypothetical protein
VDANLITVLPGVLGSVSGASAIAIFLIPVTFYVIERLFAGREEETVTSEAERQDRQVPAEICPLFRNKVVTLLSD